MPDPHPWTTRALAKSLRASRLSYAAIARAVGVAKSTVLRWLEGPRQRTVRLRARRRYQESHLGQHREHQARYRLRRKLEGTC